MAFCPILAIDSASTSVIDTNAVDNTFRLVVFEFIEQIDREVAFYEDYEPKISANDFRRIELQIQAQRVEKILKLCIAKIHRIFHLSNLIEQHCDHLKLIFTQHEAQQIEKFAQKWSNQTTDASNSEFIFDLNECLDIVAKQDAAKEWTMVFH